MLKSDIKEVLLKKNYSLNELLEVALILPNNTHQINYMWVVGDIVEELKANYNRGLSFDRPDVYLSIWEIIHDYCYRVIRNQNKK